MSCLSHVQKLQNSSFEFTKESTSQPNDLEDHELMSKISKLCEILHYFREIDIKDQKLFKIDEFYESNKI
jgi:hypothetical protein